VLKEALLWKPEPEGRVACGLCSHRCLIAPGKFGTCGVRENRSGSLWTHVYGEVIAAHVDPIEKKPLYHFYPGSKSFSLATAGCNFRCPFCQNWQISQSRVRDGGGGRGEALEPKEAVRLAKAYGCRSISYTYTEPTIFFEYAADTGRLAKAEGLANNFVTNGYMTAETLEAARGWLDACNVDLKAFREKTYKDVCGAHLEPVLESIRLMRRLGMWVEVTTLVVPGLNDSPEELRDMARFLAGVGRDIPWHISRFHPDYKYTEAPATPIETLERAASLGAEEGLHYIYIGNVWGAADDTRCPKCGTTLIKRRGFSASGVKIKDGRCSKCGQGIAGIY
jgi:pyruvate formate lyase activating enzyme